jgi:hypothetical protein
MTEPNTPDERVPPYIRALSGLTEDDPEIQALASTALMRWSLLDNTVDENFAPSDDMWQASEPLAESVHLAVCRFIVQSSQMFIDDERREAADEN